MRTRTRAKAWAVVAIIIVTVMLAACSGGGKSSSVPEAVIDAEAVVNDRCTQCHSIDRVIQAKKSQEQWQSTVANMVGRGAKLNADEQTAVVNYLAEKYGP